MSEGVALDHVSAVSAELTDAIHRLAPQLSDGPPPDEETIGRVLEAGGRIVVARLDGAIVGVGTVIIAAALSGTTAHVEDVVVDEAARGRGIGELLVRELIGIAHAEGADEVALTSHPRREAANRLYPRLGFELGGTNYYTLELEDEHG